jgi:hypothetical protein
MLEKDKGIVEIETTCMCCQGQRRLLEICHKRLNESTYAKHHCFLFTDMQRTAGSMNMKSRNYGAKNPPKLGTTGIPFLRNTSSIFFATARLRANISSSGRGISWSSSCLDDLSLNGSPSDYRDSTWRYHRSLQYLEFSAEKEA